MNNYEMALSEIEMYKKAHESLSENLTHANKKTQQFKTERDTLIDDLKTLRKLSEALKASENSLWLSSREFERERDELAAKVSRLERENEKQLELLQDFSKFINYKLEVSPASDTYKHYRSELDKLGVK